MSHGKGPTKRRLTAEELVEYIEIQLSQGHREAAIREVASVMRAGTGTAATADDEISALKKRLRELAWDWLRRAGGNRSERIQGMKDAHYELLELVGLFDEGTREERPATRQESGTIARQLTDSLRIPAGYRVVVAATDVTGKWVGVCGNVDDDDTEAILRAALSAAQRIDHG